jgi:hypothetical protein
MDEAKLTLLVMTVAVLLPILPALLLFKALPSSKGEVKGPFKGLQIKFGGAFAGYLVILVLILRYLPSSYTTYSTWTVMGRIAFQHDPQLPDPNSAEISVRLVPPHLELDPGPFTFEVPVTKKPDGTLVFPTLRIDVKDYQSLSIPLDPEYRYGALELTPKYDYKKRTIGFEQPLTMTMSSYSPTGAQQAKPIKQE